MKVLLYSGGLDSYLINALWKPDRLLYVDLCGEYSRHEVSRLPENCIVVRFPWLGTTEQASKFVPLRNLYFLMVASQYGDEICLGATAGDWGNKDKTPDFLDEAETIINHLLSDKKCQRKIHLCRDFISVPKSELIERYLSLGNSAETLRRDTFSCYTPTENGEPCFSCYPCFRKFALLYAAGAYYTKREREKMWNYIKREIIPTKEQGGYQGTYYTDRGEESESLVYCVERLKEEFSK